MIKEKIGFMAALLVPLILTACGNSAEERSLSLDHKVPSYEVLTDSLVVDKLQEVNLSVRVADESGLYRLVFSYGDWMLNEIIYMEKAPEEYLFETSIAIPENAKTSWEEITTYHDGSTAKITQSYHKLTLSVTDVNMNVRTVPIYVKVR